jgi:hypothetical protein
MTGTTDGNYLHAQAAALADVAAKRMRDMIAQGDRPEVIDVTVRSVVDDGDGVAMRTTLRFEIYETGSTANGE